MTTRKCYLMTLLLLFALAEPVFGQDIMTVLKHKTPGTCDYWLVGKDHEHWRFYRLGLAYGYTMGVLSDVNSYYLGPATLLDPPRRTIQQQYERGLVDVLVRPAVLLNLA